MSCDSRERALAARVAPSIAAAIGCSEADARELVLELRERATAEAERRETSADALTRLRQKANDAEATETCAALFRWMRQLDPPIEAPAHGEADTRYGVPLPSMAARHGWAMVATAIESAEYRRPLPQAAWVTYGALLARQLPRPAAPSPDLVDLHAMPDGFEKAHAFRVVASVLDGDAQREAVLGAVTATADDGPQQLAGLLPELRDWTREERQVVLAICIAAARRAGRHQCVRDLLALLPSLDGACDGRASDVIYPLPSRAEVVGTILADIASRDVEGGEAAFDSNEQAKALLAFAPHATLDETRRALAIAQQIGMDGPRLRAMVVLAANLPADERRAFYAEHNLAAACQAHARNVCMFGGDLSFVAAYAAQEGEEGIQALLAALPRDDRSADILCAAIPHAADRMAALDSAEQSLAWVMGWHKVHLITRTILPHAPPDRQSALAAQAFASLRDGGVDRFGTLVRLMPYLPPKHDEAILALIANAEPVTRPALLASLAFHREANHRELAHRYRDQAIHQARKLRGKESRAMAMARLRRALVVGDDWSHWNI